MNLNPLVLAWGLYLVMSGPGMTEKAGAPGAPAQAPPAVAPTPELLPPPKEVAPAAAPPLTPPAAKPGQAPAIMPKASDPPATNPGGSAKPAPGSQPAGGGAPAVMPPAAPLPGGFRAMPYTYPKGAYYPQMYPPVAPPTAQFPGYPGGEEENGGYQPVKEEPPPQAKVVKSYEDGKIIVTVGSTRNYAIHIGDTVTVTIEIDCSPEVMVDLTAIQKGHFGMDGSHFKWFDEKNPGVKLTTRYEGQRTIHRLELVMQTFVTLNEGRSLVADGQLKLDFTMDFMYATKIVAGYPEWKREKTPKYIFTVVRTADDATDLIEGDLDEAPVKVSWLAQPALFVSMLLMFLAPVYGAFRLWRWLFPPHQLQPHEAAWKVFDEVFAEGKAKGFTARHFEQIAAALGTYFCVSSLTVEEIEARVASGELDLPENKLEELTKALPILLSALRRCQPAIIEGDGLPADEELDDLQHELTQLVPRE